MKVDNIKDLSDFYKSKFYIKENFIFHVLDKTVYITMIDKENKNNGWYKSVQKPRDLENYNEIEFSTILCL